ncbi:MAG TPA: thiamine phosphate synthase [Nitrospiria bacterium]|nr:thiamine phosphate synthase [Nitrospiria bacterium]
MEMTDIATHPMRVPTGLYLIADRQACGSRPVAEVVRAATAAGVRWVQYRDKSSTRLVRYEEALRLRRLTREAGAALIINDELDVAVAVEADGLHLGQEDLPLPVARRWFGGRLIGVSTHTLEDARRAIDEGADYIAVGPIFATSIKSDRTPVGCDAIRRVRALTSIPLVAIGGITPETIGETIRAGATSAAVISGLCGAAEVGAAVAAYLRSIAQAHASVDQKA